MPRAASMRCPFPDHDDREPSFSIIRKSNSFFCHGCQRSGSVIDLVLHVNNCNAAQAVEWLRREFHSERHRFSSSKALNIRGEVRSKPSSERPPAAAPDFTILEKFISANPLMERGAQYLLDRHISKQTSSRFMLGYVADARESLHKLIADVGQQKAALAGLTLGYGDRMRLVFPNHSIIFPFFQEGRIVYLQSRATATDAKIRWMGLSGISKPIYNTDSIKSAKDIYICEGCIDVLSAHELGRTAIGLMGAATKLPSSVIASLKATMVYIVPDRDDAGARMADATRDSLKKRGVQCVVQTLNVGKDLNEYLAIVRTKS